MRQTRATNVCYDCTRDTKRTTEVFECSLLRGLKEKKFRLATTSQSISKKSITDDALSGSRHLTMSGSFVRRYWIDMSENRIAKSCRYACIAKKPDGHVYVWVYDDETVPATLANIGSQAANSDLSLTWHDASLLTQCIVERKDDLGDITNEG